VLGADVIVQQPIGLLGSKLQDALGLGAEWNLNRRRDLFAKDVRPSISLRMLSRERCDRAKIRLVSPLPSRINPRRRCSVSMEILPS
jgi:hypothetical protein